MLGTNNIAVHHDLASVPKTGRSVTSSSSLEAFTNHNKANLKVETSCSNSRCPDVSLVDIECDEAQ